MPPPQLYPDTCDNHQIPSKGVSIATDPHDNIISLVPGGSHDSSETR